MPETAPADEIEVPRVVRVLPNVPAVHRSFDYRVPEAAGPLIVGTEVRVDLRGRRVRGWVTEVDVVPEAGFDLLPLRTVRGWGPPPAVVSLAEWCAWRWAGSLAQVLRTAAAPGVVRRLPAAVAGRPPTDERGSETEQPSLAGSLAADALAGGTSVVWLPPVEDPFDLILAAADRLPSLGEGAVAGVGEQPGVLVLVPSMARAERLARRLREAGRPVACLPGEWAEARGGGCIAVGSRAAALAPLPTLAAAVVVDAHDDAYQQEQAPTWRAWEVVAERARRDGAPCALVTPCPTAELVAAGRTVRPEQAAERAGWPPVEVIDRREQDPRTGLLSERVAQLVRWAGEAPGRRVVVVHNRTGRVRLLACERCGTLARCQRCRGALSMSEAATVLTCVRCGEAGPRWCAACRSTALRALRLGVSRVRDEIEALARVPVAEVSGRPRGVAAEEERERVEVERAAVVVGTEAVLHRVGWADVVVFLDLDGDLLAPRLAAGSRVLAQLARAARMVGARTPGSGRRPGRVVVHTRQPDHEAVAAARRGDPSLFVTAETELRSALGLPPFRAVATIAGAAAEAFASAVEAVARAEAEVAGTGSVSFTVRAPDHRILADVLAAAARPPGRLRVAVDDPGL